MSKNFKFFYVNILLVIILCKNIICNNTCDNICNKMIQLLKTVQLAILNKFKRLRKIKVR